MPRAFQGTRSPRHGTGERGRKEASQDARLVALDAPRRRGPGGGGAARGRSSEGGRRRTSAGERRRYKVRSRKQEAKGPTTVSR
jgi:hypothetical protein